MVESVLPESMIIVVLPAYNEEEAIGSLLQEIESVRDASGLWIMALVVDDASRDRTRQVAESYGGAMPVNVISHPENRGLGGALDTGLRAALDPDRSADIVVTMDADLTHSPSYIPQLVAPIHAGEKDVMIASRYAPGGQEVGVPAVRVVLSRGASLAYGFLAAIDGVRDYSCGYRAMKADLLRRAFDRLGDGFISETGFQATGEIVLKLRHFHARFGEVGFQLRYDLKPGASKMSKLRTAFGTLELLFRHGRFGKKPFAD